MSDAQRWVLRRKSSAAFIRHWREMGLDPVLAKVLWARKIDTETKIRAFLGSDAELGDPFAMKGMSQAVSRIQRALRDEEQIVVYGDFDVDGVSSAALLVTALTQVGAMVSHYVPDRFSEGYGLNTPALQKLAEQGIRLAITTDCGTRSVVEVAAARDMDLDVIITDHHSVPDELPPAVAILNPHQPNCDYPFKYLAGVGVVHRLVDGLYRTLNGHQAGSGPWLDASAFIDLVALGTVADVVPLQGENRTLVRRGLKRMQDAPRPGLRALMEAADVASGRVDSEAIGFRLGPRLNAAGRLDSARIAYRLLTSDSADQAQDLARTLDAMNQERKQLLESQVREAREQLGDVDERKLLFVAGPDYHEGIVGLIAGRLASQFSRPAIVVRRDGDAARGSARSIDGFDISKALDTVQDLLGRYGGHAQAAGFSVPSDRLQALHERLEAYAEEKITEEMLCPKYSVDAIVSLDEITEKTVTSLGALEPCGEGNPPPMLASLGLELVGFRPVGREGRHLKLALGDGQRTLQAIAFRLGHLASSFRPGDVVDVIYRPDLNEWRGLMSLQLVVEAMRHARGDRGDGASVSDE